MKQVLIVKNITREGPGLVQEVLRDTRIKYKVVDLNAGQSFPNPRE